MKINQKKMQIKFLIYINEFIDEAIKNNDDTRLNGYLDKRIHSFFVKNLAAKVADDLIAEYNIKEEYKELFTSTAMLHDTGRFEQLRQTKTFYDFNSYNNNYAPNYDHGDHGYYLLKSGLMDYFIKDKTYHNIILNSIKDHSKSPDVINLDIHPDTLKYMNTYTPGELLESNNKEMIASLQNLITQVIRDVDRLDIYRKISKEKWIPMVDSNPVHEDVLNDYYSGNFKSMNEYRANKTWNVNTGHLVRLNFIQDIKLVSIMKQIRDENFYKKIYNMHLKNGDNSIELLEEEYKYATKLVNELCLCGDENNMFIDDDKRLDTIEKLKPIQYKKHI